MNEALPPFSSPASPPVDGLTTRLTLSTAVDAFPSWSPDGTEIAFMSNRSGKDQVYTMDAATGGSQLRITHTSVEEWAPAWGH